MTILFRADGNATIGAGHIMRCLSLAQALKDSSGAAVFLCADPPKWFVDRVGNDADVQTLNATPYTKEDAAETVTAARDAGAAWIVLDGYSIDESYEKILKDAGLQVLRLDDYSHLPSYTANIILNQNAHVKSEDYAAISPNTQLLLGTGYTMLQRSFRKSIPQTEVPENAKNVLITLGGSDPDNLTPTVIRALKECDVHLTVVVGGGNPYGDDVRKAVEETEVSADVVLNASNMHELMNKADLAVTAAGSTCYELAYMGVPMMTITVAENQKGVAAGLTKHNAAIDLGWKTDLTESGIQSAVQRMIDDQEKRRKLQEAGKKLIDGQGAFRVLMNMKSAPLRLQKATQEDCEMIFQWANDPTTRKVSFSSEEIPWEDHVTWYQNKMSDDSHLFFVGYTKEDEPLGQVRFDCNGATASISVNIAPEMRGKKYSVPLVTEGCARLFGETVVDHIDAFIKPENEASVAVFTKAGFSESDPAEVRGISARHFVFKRDMISA